MDYKNKTALVTGASSGIGREYARELAKRGSNLILVARSKDALNHLAKELESTYKVSAEVLVLDLSKTASVDKLLERATRKGTVIDFLFNNAGFGTAGWARNESLDRVSEEINLNVHALTMLSLGLLKPMSERNSGVIVNIASTAAYQPVPGLAVYAATKAFVLSFTSALWAETKDTGVKVLTVSPGATETNFFEVAGSKSFGKLAPVSEVIDATFADLDSNNSKPALVVGSRNSIMAKFSKILPAKLVLDFTAKIFLPKK